MNAGDNIDDKKDYGFTRSILKITPTVIYDYTQKILNMLLENLRPQRNIENNVKKSDERYQINLIDEKEYNERYQISENKEERLNTDIVVLIVRKLSSQKKKGYLEKYSDEINQIDTNDDKESDKRDQTSKNN